MYGTPVVNHNDYCFWQDPKEGVVWRLYLYNLPSDNKQRKWKDRWFSFFFYLLLLKQVLRLILDILYFSQKERYTQRHMTKPLRQVGGRERGRKRWVGILSSETWLMLVTKWSQLTKGAGIRTLTAKLFAVLSMPLQFPRSTNQLETVMWYGFLKYSDFAHFYPS